MYHRHAVLALVVVAAAACEQASQELPLGVDASETVTRVIGPAGGVVSTPAGLSLRFEAGSLTRSTEVTVVGRSGTDVGTPVDGDVVAGTVFDVGPSGAALGVPAGLSLAVPDEALGAGALALTALVVSGSEVRYLSEASIDLTQRILKTDLPRLGTVGLRVSDDVLDVGPAGAASAGGVGGAAGASSSARAGIAARTASFSMACGGPGEPRCSDTEDIAFTVTPELHDALNGCVQFIDPEVDVDVTIEETAGEPRAAGTVVFSGTVRYQTGSDGTACSEGIGSVHSLALDDTFTLGTPSDPWSSFTYDSAAGTLTFHATSDGPETLDCDCGPDLFAADEVWIGQTSERISFEGLEGDITWKLRLRR